MTIEIIQGDCLEVMRDMADNAINCCVTSPPFWGLRDYGVDGQLGLEKTSEEYVEKMVRIFQEVKRILRDDGTLWLNLGDSYYNYRPGNYDDNRAHSFGGDRTASKKRGMPNNPSDCKRGSKLKTLKEKDLVGIPWRVAFALQADGWYLRQDIIWAKPNPMPESVRDRCTKSHEYIFLLSKSKKYYYDIESIKENAITSGIRTNKKYANNPEWTIDKKIGQSGLAEMIIGDKVNKRSVWIVSLVSGKTNHFATFPPKLIEPCILAGCPIDGTVLDPFAGAGTVGLVCSRLNRNCKLIELKQEYCDMARKRIAEDQPLFNQEK